MYPVPEMRTPRTRIFLPTHEDAELLLHYRLENREHLKPWEPRRERAHYTLEACERSIQAGIEAAREDRGYPLLVSDPRHGRLLASFTFSNVVRGIFQACHLGYGVDHEQQGRGLMLEALQAGLDFAFGPLQLHRVMANYMPHNRRSERLLGRLGFEREGYARRYMRIDGDWQDHVLTACINPRERA